MGMLRLVFALVLAVSLCQAGFQRPWENRSWVAMNPNIWSYGGDYWWNIPEFHHGLESAGLEGVSRTPAEGPAADSMGDALEYYGDAAADRDRCVLEVVCALGMFPMTPSVATISVFSDASGCTSYKRDWQRATESLLTATEQSMEASEKSIDAARDSYETLKSMGLCGENFTGAGSKACAELRGAFLSVDNNITEGEHGNHALMLAYASELEGNLADMAPDLSPASRIISLAWGEDGVVAEFDEERTLAQEGMADAEASFKSLSDSAYAKKALAEKALGELERERLDMIDEAPSGFDARKAGSVAEGLDGLQDDEDALAAIFLEAKRSHGAVSENGYMARAIIRMESAEGGYSALIADAASLNEDAEEAVSQQGDEAKAEISRTQALFAKEAPGAEAAKTLEEAQGALESAPGAGTLGAQFAKYSRAAALARSARGMPALGDEASAQTSLESLRDLIARAEKDGIGVGEEKGRLSLICSLQPYDASLAAKAAEDSIISKARLQYEDGLLGQRKRIYDKLSLAGVGAADLYTDMSKAEDGQFVGAGLLFPQAIGSLKKLESAYEGIEGTLDGYMSEIVGNAMSVRASPLIGDVSLDEPASTTLDVVMSNPKGYNATDVAVSVSLDSPLELMYSDIVSGKGSVESMRMSDGGKTAIVVFPKVAPYETKRIVFEKESVLAHTIKRQASAEGIGDGDALVLERIEFSLDTGVKDISLPGGCDIIDGVERTGPLGAGKHIAECRRTEHEAYSEKIRDVRVYRVGVNSKVEMTMGFTPNMDLDSAAIFVDAINDTRISSFDITSATGEPIEGEGRISETQCTAKVLGLRKGKETVIRISYFVDDTESYVEERLSLLEGSNMSQGALELLSRANLQASAGNFSEALQLIEQSVALEREESKKDAKLQARYSSSRSSIEAELEEIDAALASYGTAGAFMQKLSSRRDELREALSEAEGANLNSSVALLEKIDSKWLDKEMGSLKKDLYVEYNGLKERFYEAGNTSTPAEFLSFEQALNRLETGMKPDYAAEAVAALERAESVVKSQEAAKASGASALKAALQKAESETDEVLATYLRQAAAAKGTDYSGMFTETESKLAKLEKDAEAAAGKDPRLFSEKLEQLNRSREKMEATLETLKGEAESKLSLLEASLAEKGKDDARRASMQDSLDTMRSLISQGEYVNALRSGSAIQKELEKDESPKNDGLMILGLTALAALGAIGFYMATGQPQKKELKKLTSFSGFQPQLRKGNQVARPESSGRSSRSSQPHGQNPQPEPGGSTG